jgi:hypothetical protein
MALQPEVLLINTTYLKKYSQVNGAVDDTSILPCIYVAQDMWVQPYLGDDLMNYIKANINSLPSDYQTLLDEYIMKPVVWWSLVELIPMLCYKYQDGTIGQYQTENYQPISKDAMGDQVNAARAKAVYYTQRLVDYLCHNSSLFPEYSSNTSPERCPRTKVSGSGFMFSLRQDARGVRYTVPINQLP